MGGFVWCGERLRCVSVRRFFSSFPAGAPGIALLVMRIAAVIALVSKAIAWVVSSNWLPVLGGAASFVVAILLLAGLATRVAAALAAALLAVGATGSLFYAVAIAGAITLLGPGALSVDARLFGMREIVIATSRSRT
jgi:O-antigen ligase